MIFNQGDIVIVDFDSTLGHEPQKRRPALIVSDGFFNNVLSSLTVVCPITSTFNNHPLHIEINDATIGVSGCVCLEQIRSIDLTKRNAKNTGAKMDSTTMTRVLDGIGAMFGI